MRRRQLTSSMTRGVSGVCAALLATGLAACTASSDPSGVPTTSRVPTTSAAPTTTSAEPTAEPVGLPANCGALLPVTDLDPALGVGLPGSVSYIRGEPLPGIGRTDRITCGYGIVIGPDGNAQPPLLEVSIASYTDEAAAADRIDVTTVDRQTAGDRVESTEVQGLPAVMLTGVAGTTLVFADGTWTYSLTLLAAVVPPEQMPTRLTAVAEAVLAQATEAPPT
ncbi:MAG: hypothetical protein H0V64_00975 [Geodermatophilaceae bacterium]|nr:hypothetical protein [Geodermatophilaceae bacterium]